MNSVFQQTHFAPIITSDLNWAIKESTKLFFSFIFPKHVRIFDVKCVFSIYSFSTMFSRLLARISAVTHITENSNFYLFPKHFKTVHPNFGFADSIFDLLFTIVCILRPISYYNKHQNYFTLKSLQNPITQCFFLHAFISNVFNIFTVHLSTIDYDGKHQIFSSFKNTSEVNVCSRFISNIFPGSILASIPGPQSSASDTPTTINCEGQWLREVKTFVYSRQGSPQRIYYHPHICTDYGRCRSNKASRYLKPRHRKSWL